MPRILLTLLAVGIAAAAWWLWPAEAASPDAVEDEAARRRPEAGATLRSEANAPRVRGPASTPEREEIAAARRRAEDLLVRVVDPQGRPLQGIPLTVVDTRQLHDPDAPRLHFARTDATGHATIRDGRALARDSDKPWYLVHDVVFEKQPSIELTPEELEKEVVESVQPPFGAIEVRALPGKDVPAGKLHSARLGLVIAAEADDPTLAWKRKEWKEEFVAGGLRVRFDHVELGREWMAAVYREGADTPSSARGRGPALHAELRTIDVTLGLDHPVAVFRAVDERGTPLARRKLSVTLNKDWGGSSTQELSSGTDGRFAVDTSRDSFFGQHVSVSLGEGKGGLSGSKVVPRRLQNGRTDCGDIVLRPPAPLVAGRVIDEAGKPVPGVRVRAARNVNYRGTGQHAFFLFGDRGVDGRTDERGNFTLYGEIPQEAFHVFVDDHVRSEPVAAKRGERDKLLTAYEVFTPSVDVMLSKGGKWDGLSIDLREAGSTEPGVSTTTASQSGDTVQTSLSPVRGGVYDLLWSFRGRSLGRKNGLRITKNGRIATIDLRNAVFEHVVRFTQGGEPRKDVRGTLFWQPAGDARKWEAVHFDSSPVKINSTSRAIHLRVYPAGHREQFRENVVRPQTIRLRAGLRVRLVLRTSGTLPVHPYIFDPAPHVQGKHVGEAIGSPYFTKTKNEAVFALPAGEVEVRWHLERRSHNGAVGGNVLHRHSVKIHVKETAAEQTFILELDGAALDRLRTNPPW